MQSHPLPSGIRVILPDGISLPDASIPASPSARQRAARAAEPSDFDATRRIAAALAEQDLELIDTVPLPQVPFAEARTRAEPADASLEIPLDTGEDAVVLLERDGVYAWQFDASRTEPTEPGPRRRRGVEASQRTATFRISLTSPPPEPPDGTTRAPRSALSDALLGGVRALVFKFAGRFLVGRATVFLERHVRPGVVAMKGLDPLAWANVGDFTALNLPPDRPGRILLFVHGTFSSTRGGYGGLCATPWGQAFLAAAESNYDAIVGFDHPTLSVDPRVNATDLLRALEARAWQRPAQVDVICHSRGAITLRSLTEHLLPATRLPLTIDRVVFVGGVNAGTKLAAPQNWRSLIDLYTNLAVGATRAMAMFPSAVFASQLLNELVKSVGTLAKALVDSAITEEAMPGLAAMQPDGKFIRELNGTQPGQPTPDKCRYYAITSEFEAKLALENPSELSGQFLRLLAGGFMDQLMKEVNDLVVHTASMTAIDPQVGNFIKDTLAFGRNSIVYHTNYFLQPLAVNALARWLELAMPEEAATTRRRSALAGEHVTPAVAANVDTNILVLAASATGADARAAIAENAPSYVVIERHVGGQLHRYGFKAEEILAPAQADGTLEILLGLQETGRSAEQAPGTPVPAAPNAPSASPAAQRIVVVEDGRPLGVAERTVMPTPIQELAKLAGGLSASSTEGAARRAMLQRMSPTFVRSKPADPFVARDSDVSEFDRLFSAPGEKRMAQPETTGLRVSRGDLDADAPAERLPETASATNAAPEPAPVQCHFIAEIGDIAARGQVVAVDVTISREAVEAVRKSAAAASAGVAPHRKLDVDFVPKKNFRNTGESRMELDVPAPGKPWRWTFDAQATDLGIGEIWIYFRQGPRSLVTLTLRCAVVEQPARPPQRQSADRRVAWAAYNSSGNGD